MWRVYGRTVARITPGDLTVCFVLPASRGVGKVMAAYHRVVSNKGARHRWDHRR